MEYQYINGYEQRLRKACEGLRSLCVQHSLEKRYEAMLLPIMVHGWLFNVNAQDIVQIVPSMTLPEQEIVLAVAELQKVILLLQQLEPMTNTGGEYARLYQRLEHSMAAVEYVVQRMQQQLAARN